MDDIEHLCLRARDWRGDGLALATVMSTWGSAPRPRGSHMLVNADGRFEGSVSGGCVEADVLQTAAEVIRDGRSSLKHYGVADGDAWAVGLPCGGSIEILVQPVIDSGFPASLFDAIAEARAAGRRFAVSTRPETGQSQAGAVAGHFTHEYLPPRRALIVGAVQIAQSLTKLCQAIGVRPVLIDPRGRFLTDERFPGVTLDDRWPDDAINAFAPGAATAVITLSHDPKIDDPALIAALGAPTAYVAALGSRKSHAARLDRLRAEGVGEADLARIHGPAGLDIGAIGPAEIALSIAAGMVAAFNDRG